MLKYWTSEPKQIDDSPVTMWGCQVFVEHRSMALCRAQGRSYEEAHDQAHLIIAAMKAVEQAPAAAAAAARHYLVRSPKIPSGAEYAASIMAASPADADLLEQYDRYFDGCQQSNRIPKTFDQWKAGHHD